MRRLALLFVLPVFLTAAPAAFAQSAAPEPARMDLSATGSVSVTPDQAHVSSGVVTRADNAADALRANGQAMTRVFAELRRAGVAERDMQTRQLTVSPVYSQPGRDTNESRRITGYEARNTVTALIRDLDRTGPVIDALVNAGANQLEGVRFGYSREDEARNEARRAAVEELHARRDLYSDIGGFRIVRLLSFSESGGYRPESGLYAVSMRADSSSTPVAAGEMTIEVTVNAGWEIEG
ncbi:MAG: SIMPL domain-containing protein [Oceanicaulis sp.]|nr:SIMPL domain-containing protein [Oceanicaulis sp.]